MIIMKGLITFGVSNVFQHFVILFDLIMIVILLFVFQ